MKKKTDGYFTVEAAMVMPMVLSVVFLIIYLLFFQYNRCLMEQDVGLLVMGGIYMEVEDNEERIQELRKLANLIYEEKYIAWECGAIELKLERGKLSAEQSGWLSLPIRTFGHGRQTVETTVRFKNHIVSPVSFIRNYHKVIGG